MPIEILSDEIIINLMVSSSKELLSDPFYSYYSYTVFTAFESIISWLYNHGQARKLVGSNVDKKRFRASIYSYLRHGANLPDSVVVSASSFYRNTRRSTEKDANFISELLTAENKQSETVRKAEIEQAKAIRKNEKETEAIRKLLGYQHIGGIDIIDPLLTYAKNHGGIDTMVYISLFNYGFIEGKRAERARRKRGITT